MIQNFSKDTTVNVPYGSKGLNLLVPAGSFSLQPEDPVLQTSPDTFRKQLYHYLKAADLDLSRPVLVVADKTRTCGYPDYLPVLAETINTLRGQQTPFTIIIAYGTHPRQSDPECSTAYGRLYESWPFIHHDCSDRSLFREMAVTVSGTPVRMRTDLLEASVIITMGPMCHHYFAGYGGGRKMVFPGCGERESIFANHSLFLDRANNRLSPQCQPGNLKDNPVAEDLFEIESHLPAHLAIHGIQDSRGMICDFLIGQGRETFLEACKRHAAHYEVNVEPVDTVVTSCGGFPKDINFIQTHKTIHNSAAFVRDGGRLIVFTECPDGVGSQTFLPWYQHGGFNAAFARMKDRYEGNGGTALAMMSKTSRIQIALVTDLDQATCSLLKVDKWSTAQAEQHLVQSRGQTAWIPNASLLVNKKAV